MLMSSASNDQLAFLFYNLMTTYPGCSISAQIKAAPVSTGELQGSLSTP
jgi:hypothetical protein